MLTGIVLLVVVGLAYTQRKHLQVPNLIMLCITVVLIGYSSYTLIFIRSAANPPIDENDPETAEAIVSYLKREQYGATPLFSGATFDNRSGRLGEEEGARAQWAPVCVSLLEELTNETLASHSRERRHGADLNRPHGAPRDGEIHR